MKINGQITLSGDKSISHRALMISSISKGVSRISNLCNSRDVQSTIACLKSCGADIDKDGPDYLVRSNTLSDPLEPLNCGNSGTTIRLLVGLLAGCGIKAELYGDSSLMSRPMDRVINPLKEMGADIIFRDNRIILRKSAIKSTSIDNKIPSAQVKSCIILAGIGSQSHITVNESHDTRDHTERMIEFFSKESVISDNRRIVIEGHTLGSENLIIPGDISKASFLIACACLAPQSDLIIQDVLINRRRTGFINSLKKMGADIEVYNKKVRHNESVADIRIKYNGQLKNINIISSETVRMIDEIPILAVIASFSKGVAIINGIKELRVKESDRVNSIAYNLKAMSCDVRESGDLMMIKGRKYLYNTKIKTFSDHRIAMAFYIASFFSKGKMVLDDMDCIGISFPDFFDKIKEVSS